MDWDTNGDISFGEFVYAFTKWVDLEEEEPSHDSPEASASFTLPAI